MQKLRIISFLVGVVSSVAFTYAEATSSPQILQETEKTYLSRVISIEKTSVKDVPNTDVQATYTTATVKFLSGDKLNETQKITDSGFPLKVGDKVYVRYIKTADGNEYFSIQEPYRLPALFWLLMLFIVVVLVFGGKQGMLAIIALFISFGVVFKMVFPSIINGGNVVFISTLGALLSLFVVMFVTHGFSRLTISAFLGCTFSIVVTVFLAKYAVAVTSLTGFSSEESVYLNIATRGNMDFIALLVGGIIIGVIGVVDDVAITQASVVNELRSANPNLSPRALYAKALKVGKDHMGAVINTLILAYTGASLPLILAVPLTTFIAVLLMHNTTPLKDAPHHHHH